MRYIFIAAELKHFANTFYKVQTSSANINPNKTLLEKSHFNGNIIH